ncbi:MAG TPA: glycosyltransferase [Solirubrobacteraceae bacterium]
MVTASVVICTHNRAGLIGRAVEAAVAEARVGGGDVLVVDNASSDETPAVLARLAATHAPVLRVVREPELGLSVARNRALREVRHEIAAFLDDDAVPRPGWLAALCLPYADAAVACVGGRIRLQFASPPPSWLVPALHSALSAFDAGDTPRRLRYGRDTYPYGANISYRVTSAGSCGGFSPRVGLRGRSQLQHEETDLCYRLEHAGGEVHYAPDAVVDHHIAPERLTPAWFLTRHRRGGESAAIFVLRSRGLARALWRIRWLYGHALLTAPYVPTEPIDARRLAAECQRQEALGYLVGLARALPRMRTLRREAAEVASVARTSALGAAG